MSFLIARASKHFWEEPIISGTQGSGTIFFGGCNMRCVFCQNYKISRTRNALLVSSSQLLKLMRWLEEEGAHNINLVSPSHYIKKLPKLLTEAKKFLKIPIVYNSSGFDNPLDLRALEGLVDIYLPDLKYYDSALSKKYSLKEEYFSVASKAIAEMRRQVPIDVVENQLMKRGVIVRHLVLPTHVEDSCKVLDYLAELDPSLLISLMAQYFPCGNLEGFDELNRRITLEEYETVRQHFFKIGLNNGFMQDLDSAIEDYVPDFDIEALKKLLFTLEAEEAHQKHE